MQQKKSDSEEKDWEKQDTTTGVRFLNRGVGLATKIHVVELDLEDEDFITMTYL